MAASGYHRTDQTGHAFRVVWEAFGPFNIGLMACTASAHRPPLDRLPPAVLLQIHLWRLARHGRVGTERHSATGRRVGFCFPPSPLVAGHIVHHLAECRAHAVVLLSDVRGGSRCPDVQRYSDKPRYSGKVPEEQYSTCVEELIPQYVCPGIQVIGTATYFNHRCSAFRCCS